jgi:hypothetical protein
VTATLSSAGAKGGEGGVLEAGGVCLIFLLCVANVAEEKKGPL